MEVLKFDNMELLVENEKSLEIIELSKRILFFRFFLVESVCGGVEVIFEFSDKIEDKNEKLIGKKRLFRLLFKVFDS